jgi:hypothetical protein
VLRILREGMIFLAMTALIERFGRLRGGTLDPRILRTAFVLAFAFLLIALVQTFALERKIYVGIPRQFFVQNENTIPDALDLLFSKLRPNGTFGEPSYFAFILISLFVMFLPLARKVASVRVMLLGLILAGILSQSLAFVLALPLVVLFGYLPSAPPGERMKLFGAAMVLLAVSYFVGHDTVAPRLQNGIFSSGDVSTYQRVMAPLSILWDFLVRHPLGVTFSTLPSVLQPAASKWGILGASILMNGILNALFCYGVFGAVLVGAYLLSARDMTLRAYLLICACFNGALFAVDKFCIICLTVSLYTLSAAMAREQRPMPVRPGISLASLPGLRKIDRRQNPI